VTIVWNPRTGNAEADIRRDGLGRLHISLKTKKVGEANDRYAAVKALYLEGNADLIGRLRGRKLPLESIVRVHRQKKPFETLLETAAWPTLEEASAEYLLWIRQTDRAEGTHTLAKWHLEAAVKYFGGGKRLDAISHDDVEAWKTELLSKQTKLSTGEMRTIKPYTAALSLVRLNALYTWVIKREARRAALEKRSPRLLNSPVDREIVPKKSAPRQRFLSREEAQRLLAAAPDSLKFPIATGLLAGLRIDEVCTLRPPPQDINLEVGGGIILVQEKRILGRDKPWRPKGKKARDIPIESELLPLVLRHAEKYSAPSWMVPSVFDADRPISKHTLAQMFERVVRDAGLIPGQRHPSGVTFHTLRHTFASWLVMAGVDLFTVSKLMGHSDTKQVEETYGHLSPNHKRIAIDRLAQSYQLGLEATSKTIRSRATCQREEES